MRRKWLIAGLMMCCGAAMAQPKGVLWRQVLDAPLVQAPLVADVLPERGGLEVVATSDSPGNVLCFGAGGEALWKTPLGEGLRPVAPVAYGVQRDQAALIAVGASDGAVLGLDAVSGVERWRAALTAPVTALLWADLDDQGNSTLVAAAGAAVVALDAAGQERWRYTTDNPVLALSAGDIDDTRTIRIFGVAGTQVFALDATGQSLWQTELAGTAAGSLALSDADGDRLAELYVATVGAAPVLVALDADTGSERWQTPLDPLPDFQPAHVVAGDLERDASGEILVAGTGGIVALGGEGTLRWSVATDTGAAADAVLGDVDRDGRPDVLVAVPGHALLVLGSDGSLQYRSTEPAPVSAPVLADLNGDKDLELIVAGANQALMAFRTPGYATPVLLPWPMAGADAARTNATLADPALADPGFVVESVPLLNNGGFESGLAGWESDPADALAAAPEAMSGVGAAQVTPGAGVVVLRTVAVPLDPAVHALNPLVFGKGDGAQAAVVEWRKGTAVVRRDRLRALPANSQGWRRFTANNLIRPAAADAVALALENAANAAAPVLWDEASMLAGVERIPQVSVVVNQVGFEAAYAKHFTAWSSTLAPDARFVVVGEGSGVRYEGVLGEGKRIVDAFGKDWGAYYYRGDFSPVEEPGNYRIEVTLGDMTVTSSPFKIQADLYLTDLMGPALAFLQAHRADGGWQAPGADAPGDTAALTYALAETYDVLAWRFKPRLPGESLPTPQLLQEAQYGAGALLASPPATSAAAAALARVARLVPGDPALAPAARTALDAAVAGGAADGMAFNAAVNLLLLGEDDALHQLAERLLPAPAAQCAEMLLQYEPMCLSGQALSFDVATDLIGQADAMLKQAQNPFGVYAPAVAGKSVYFGTTSEAAAAVGNTHTLLEATRVVAQAFRFNPNLEYLGFIADQFNWLLGNNPDGVCLVGGLGTQPLPGFHGGDAGADVLGGIANGYVGRGAGDDRPSIDLTAGPTAAAASNGMTLDNVAAWIQTIGYLKRIRH